MKSERLKSEKSQEPEFLDFSIFAFLVVMPTKEVSLFEVKNENKKIIVPF